jgi:hypothetical protein
MSEEKLYVVKNDEGEWMSLDGTQTEIWYSNNPTLFKDKSYAEAQSMGRKAHVVELVEPEKVVLTKEQAKIVKGAHNDKYPAYYISSKSNDEELLMNAYVNGYTMEKEKKYNVKVPQKWSGDDKHYWTKEQDGTLTWAHLSNKGYMIPAQRFTLNEIEHYGLQDCEKVWCDSDD